VSEAHRYHVGHPVDPAEAMDLMRRGLKPYLPTNPVETDQTEYIRFAAKRGPNSEA
jgi:hypothetical protein